MILSITIVCTQLNGFKYFYLTLIILFNINHLFAHTDVVSSIANTNSFICTQFSHFECYYLVQIILYDTIHSFAHS